MLEPDLKKIKDSTLDELYKELAQIDNDLRDFEISAYRYDKLYRFRGVISGEIESRIK